MSDSARGSAWPWQTVARVLRAPSGPLNAAARPRERGARRVRVDLTDPPKPRATLDRAAYEANSSSVAAGSHGGETKRSEENRSAVRANKEGIGKQGAEQGKAEAKRSVESLRRDARKGKSAPVAMPSSTALGGRHARTRPSLSSARATRRQWRIARPKRLESWPFRGLHARRSARIMGRGRAPGSRSRCRGKKFAWCMRDRGRGVDRAAAAGIVAAPPRPRNWFGSPRRARIESTGGHAPIAQLDRALVYGTRCRKFESSWARSGSR
jgi:hypothetical protein